MEDIVSAILSSDATSEDFAALTIPESYRACVVRKEESAMFDGIPSADKDPRKSLNTARVATPELGPGEALVAVMASSINYNTVWTSIFEPLPTFGFLERYGEASAMGARHDLPYHVIGSDLAGVVLRSGPGVASGSRATRSWRTACRWSWSTRGARRHDARPGAADLGIRDQLRRARGAGAGEVQPADAEAGAPDLGGGRRPWPGELHGLPAVGLATTARG